VKEEDTLGIHLDIMEQIGTKGVSSDESDFSKTPEVFWRVSPCWRLAELELFLYRLDKIYVAKKTTNIGHRRRPSGCPQRQRLHSDKVNHNASVPQGLLRNCYDAEWLISLSRFNKGKLEVQDMDYDFAIPEELGRGDDHSSDVMEEDGEVGVPAS
jgi:hypothetical protein